MHKTQSLAVLSNSILFSSLLLFLSSSDNQVKVSAICLLQVLHCCIYSIAICNQSLYPKKNVCITLSEPHSVCPPVL